MNKHLIATALLALAALTPSAAGAKSNNEINWIKGARELCGGGLSFDVGDRDFIEVAPESDQLGGLSVCIEWEARAKFWTLVGEPVRDCIVRYRVTRADVNGKRVPREVLDDIRMTSAELRLEVKVRGASNAVALRCDAGALARPDGKTWSFNMPGSPGWDETLWLTGYRKWLEKLAKEYLLQRDKWPGTVHLRGKVNAWAAKHWYYQTQVEALPERKRQVASRERANLGSFADFMADVEEAAEVEHVERSGQEQAGKAREAARKAAAAVAAAREEAENFFCEEAEKKYGARLKSADADTALSARQAAYDLCLQIELEPFKEGDLWGYRTKLGEVRIKPQFHCAKKFEKGRAVVCSEKRYKTVKGGYCECDTNYTIWYEWDINSNGQRIGEKRRRSRDYSFCIKAGSCRNR